MGRKDAASPRTAGGPLVRRGRLKRMTFEEMGSYGVASHGISCVSHRRDPIETAP